MAANNYFGFTTGGTQYGTAPAAAAAATYQATQAAAAAAAAGYAVQHATQPYATATPRASQAAYETYQTAGHTTTTYPYASRQQAYEKAQTYYPQPTQVAYSTTETAHYQSAVTKPSYTASTPAYTSPRPTAGQKTQGPANQTGSSSSYMFTTGAASNTSGSYTSTYNASATTNYNASMYVQPASMGGQTGSTGTASTVGTNASQATTAGTAVGANKVATATWASFRKGPMKPQKPKQPPKPQQLHYCEVCKISCAGPQTYREHLEGQKHKKKEAAMKAGTSNQNVRGGTSLRCELCDVTCTGSDAYAAHIRGSKHQKVVKLHTKLGKPIPSTEPVVISNATNSPVSSTTTGTTSTAKSSAGTTTTGKTATNSTTDASKKIIGAPKINFVGGSKLNTTVKEDPKTDEDEAKEDSLKMDDKPDVQPVGQDYIEEIKNDEGKVISFQCKLCECRFNDPNAKEMHMKGRRHRLQYKRKVNPDLVVDIKPSLRQRKIQEERLRRQQMREDYWKRREEERWREEMRMMEEEERMYWEERRRYEEEMEYYEYYRRYGRDPRMMPPPPMPPRNYAPPLIPPMGPVMGGSGKRPESSDDKHVLAKHTLIYPKEEELAMVQKIVTNTEKALKLVSDFLAESDAPPPSTKDKPKEKEETAAKDAAAKKDPPIKKEPLIAKEPLIKEPLLSREGEINSEQNMDCNFCSADKSEEENLGNQPQRALKGVMRVGVLAKGLLLTGDQAVQLVVMCSEKPTRTLLDRVADNLPKQLASVAPDEKYEVKRCVEEAALVVTALAEPKMSVTITLTSPIMREAGTGEGETSTTPSATPAAAVENIKDPPDVLDRQKCLEALAALRHAKWFQARASGLPSCVMIIRILRDLCQRVPTWGRLNSWATELLVEKVISSTGQSLSPGDALRRVLEAIAFGIILPGGPGLMDPCEKDPVDAAGSLTNQEREDITASAQHALRLIAFRQIHKVLGMDPLPPPKFTRNQFSRKRRRDASAGEGNDSEGADGKKDKKDDSEVKTEGMEVNDSQAKA